MTIFLCEPGYTGILSGIYDAGVSKIPQDELRLEIKNSGQNVELFAVYRECSPSEEKGKKVLETVRQRLNSHIQEQLYVASLSEDVLRADKMYRYLKVLFLRGASAADQLQIPAVHEIFKLCRSVYNEKHQFIEFLRFSQMEGGFLAGKIQPKNDVLELIAPYFADRLGEENWLIYMKEGENGFWLNFHLMRWNACKGKEQRKTGPNFGRLFLQRSLLKREKIQTAREITCLYGSGIL